MENNFFFVSTLDGVNPDFVRNITEDEAKDFYWNSVNEGTAGLYGNYNHRTEDSVWNDVKRLFDRGVKHVCSKPIPFNAEETSNKIMAKFGVKLVAKIQMHGMEYKETTFTDYKKYFAKCSAAHNDPECSYMCGGFRVIEVVFGNSKPYTYLAAKQHKTLGEIVINNRKAKVISYNILTPKKLYEIADKNHKSVDEFFKVI